jgi:endoglycosylceramidase
VAGGFIRDPEGRAVILRGANVSGRHKEPPYFDFHGPADYARMRTEWGMNSVRYLVSWAALEPEQGAYNQAYLEELHRRVMEATGAGLLVFLDLHQDLYGEGFAGGNGMPRWMCDPARYAAFAPREPWFLNYLSPEITACYDGFWTSRDLQAKYVAAWQQIAERFVDVPGVIGFDPMNEPYWGSIPPDVLESTRLANLYRAIIAAVRTHRPDWIAFLEPAASRNLGIPTHLPTFSEPNIVYAPHSYDAAAESGEGFDPSRRQAIEDDVARLRAEADARGGPVLDLYAERELRPARPGREPQASVARGCRAPLPGARGRPPGDLAHGRGGLPLHLHARPGHPCAHAHRLAGGDVDRGLLRWAGFPPGGSRGGAPGRRGRGQRDGEGRPVILALRGSR